MDVKNIIVRDGKDGALPSVAHNIRILLVGHDTTSLMSLASQFEQHFYKVSTTDSAEVALSLFRARKNYYNIVIADLDMREMEIFELVDTFHCQYYNIPVILMVEDRTMDLAKKALDYGDCYLLSKPLSHGNIATLWQHIYRVTGEMPTSLIDTTFIEGEKNGNQSSGSSCDGGGSNQKQRKLIKTEDDGCNSKKSRMTWTSSLHKKFLQAINILGEQRAQPETLLRMMNEPCFTLHHISCRLQEYRDQKGHAVNLQKNAGPVMPTVRPAAPISGFLQRKTTGTENIDYVAACVAPQIPRSPSWLKPPNSAGNYFAGYTLDYVREKLDAWNRERAGATGDVMLSSNHEYKPRVHHANAGNSANKNIHNVGEGTSTNQEYDGMPINDNIKQITQDTKAVKHLESTSGN